MGRSRTTIMVTTVVVTTVIIVLYCIRTAPRRTDGERMKDVKLVKIIGADGTEYATYAPYEWKDEDTDRIMVKIMRIKENGRRHGQYISLEKFKELLKKEVDE